MDPFQSTTLPAMRFAPPFTLHTTRHSPKTAGAAWKLIALVIGSGLALDFELVGTLFATEVILMVLASATTIVAIKCSWVLPRHARTLIPLLLLMTTAYVVSDVFNDNSADNAFRGFARCVVLLADFIGLLCLLDRKITLITWICAGYAIVEILLTYFADHSQDFIGRWKFGYAWPLTLLLLIATARFSRKGLLISAFLVGSLGYAQMYLDYRSLSGVCLAIAAVFGYRGALAILEPRSKMFVISITTLSFLTVIGVAYWATESAYADRRAGGNAARLATLSAAVEMIAESPLLGKGSWAYGETFGNLYDDAYFDITGRRYVAVAGPTAPFAVHSQLLQAWYEGGVIPLACFVYITWLILRGCYVVGFGKKWEIYSGLLLGILVLSLWHVLQSPFAGEHRFWIALSAAIAIGVLEPHTRTLEQNA